MTSAKVPQERGVHGFFTAVLHSRQDLLYTLHMQPQSNSSGKLVFGGNNENSMLNAQTYKLPR